MLRPLALPAVLAVVLAASGCATPFYMGQQPTTHYDRGADHMPESIRVRISTVSVQAGSETPHLYVDGDYGVSTPTAGEWAKEGAAAGVGFTGEMISEDPRTLILAPIVLPIAVISGSIAGAAAAKIKEQVQEFRDGMTDEMLDESQPQQPSAELARNVEKFLEAVDGVDILDSAEADAVLTVALAEIGIVVEGNDARISASADAILRDQDGGLLYEATFDYWDKDTLQNWTRNDNALWKQFTENAQRHIARVVSADLFESVTTRHVLRPAGNDWDKSAKQNAPSLAWDFVLLGGDEYDGTDIADNPVRFDLEVYDRSRLVYAATDIAATRHEVTADLPRCRTLSWTVRPIFTIGGRTRAGEWMRRASATERMLQQPDATFTGGKREYWDGFAEIRTRCRK